MKSNLEKYKYIWLAVVVLLMIVGYYAFGGSGEPSDTAADASSARADATFDASSLNSKKVSSGANINKNTESASENHSGNYDYTEASQHIGEQASVTGTIVDTYTSQKGTVFFDFCQSYKNCPFAAMISASTLVKFSNGSTGQFSDLDQYKGKKVTLTGIIKSYQNQAEMFIDDPSQLVVD